MPTGQPPDAAEILRRWIELSDDAAELTRQNRELRERYAALRRERVALLAEFASLARAVTHTASVSPAAEKKQKPAKRGG